MLEVDLNHLFHLYSTEPGYDQVKALAAASGHVTSAWHGRAEFASMILRRGREHPTARAHWQAVHWLFLLQYRAGTFSCWLLPRA